MTDLDLAELRRRAEAALLHWHGDNDIGGSNSARERARQTVSAFYDAATPAVVLALLDRINFEKGIQATYAVWVETLTAERDAALACMTILEKALQQTQEQKT